MKMPIVAFGPGFGGRAVISNAVKSMNLGNGVYATPRVPVISEKFRKISPKVGRKSR
jgi:hypothetical protein